MVVKQNQKSINLKHIFDCKSKFTQYKPPTITDNNDTICNVRRDLSMKATGIVRRIDE